jgi:NADH-quinone oxidoreductase subunit E
MGGDALLDTLENHLDIEAGQTTADGRITLEHVECNAACDYAPVVMVNWDFFDNQTPSSVRDLVDALRMGQPPTPSRSGALCTFRETARTLAGLPNPDSAPGAGPVGAATLAGLRFAQEHDMTAPSADQPATDSTDSTDKEDSARRADTESVAADSLKDQPAPAPSADVPAQSSTPETDPKAADSQ